MLPGFEINHAEIKKYHNYLWCVYFDESIPKEERYEVAKRICVIQDLVSIYEQDSGKDFEDLTWTEIGRPLLPEEKRELVKSLKSERLQLVK